MKILTEIKKDVFENYVPAARMPERNDSVFNRLLEQFSYVYDRLVSDVVGADYEDQLDGDTLKRLTLRFVSQQAFVTTARSLDLVLTATGFGIVSTNSMAPASKVRVDALIDEYTLGAAHTLQDIITELIQVEGWGSTTQASRSIQCLFWGISELRYTTLKETPDNWQKAKGLAFAADAFLRKAISTEYMDELLVKVRTNSLDSADSIIVQKCLVCIRRFISNYDFDKSPSQLDIDAIVQQLETYIEFYPTYQASDVYLGRHAERYANKKEDPTFFFM